MNRNEMYCAPKILMLLAMALVLSGCANQMSMAMVNPTATLVNITFDGAGCPISTSGGIPQINKGKGDKIKWQAVDAAGDDTQNQFEIFFDPFVGKSLSSNRQGWVQSKPIDSRTPIKVEFKYTIVGDTCPLAPHDPRIKIL